MGGSIKDKKLVIITEVVTIYFDLPKKICNKLTYEIDFIIKRNEYLVE